MLRYKQRIRCRQLAGSVVSYFRVAEPLLEFFQRDDLPVAFLLFFSGLFTPRIELLVGDASGLDPREALFVLLAVCLENRVVGLLFRPLPERADLAAALLTVLYRALAVLRAHAPGLREPAAAVLAAAHGHAALDAASQRVVDHVPHGGGIQNRCAPARLDRFKTQRDWLKSEQCRISRLVVYPCDSRHEKRSRTENQRLHGKRRITTKNEQKSTHRLPELLRQAAKFIFRRFPLQIPVWVRFGSDQKASGAKTAPL